MRSMLNWVTISKQDSRPKNGITGKPPIFRGTLKGLLSSDFLYLNHITERLTRAKVTKTPRLVKFATKSMFPNKIQNRKQHNPKRSKLLFSINPLDVFLSLIYKSIKQTSSNNQLDVQIHELDSSFNFNDSSNFSK
jgi:hypothetical protein